jgi:hypothetical protein
MTNLIDIKLQLKNTNGEVYNNELIEILSELRHLDIKEIKQIKDYLNALIILKQLEQI